MAEVKSYEGSLKRLNEMPGITIINDKEKERYRIKIDLHTNNSKTLFEVGNIYNAMIYLKAYTQGKKLLKCKICGKDFIRESNNQKTCSVECQKDLHKLNQAWTNERSSIRSKTSSNLIFLRNITSADKPLEIRGFGTSIYFL